MLCVSVISFAIFNFKVFVVFESAIFEVNLLPAEIYCSLDSLWIM